MDMFHIPTFLLLNYGIYLPAVIQQENLPFWSKKINTPGGSVFIVSTILPCSCLNSAEDSTILRVLSYQRRDFLSIAKAGF